MDGARAPGSRHWAHWPYIEIYRAQTLPVISVAWSLSIVLRPTPALLCENHWGTYLGQLFVCFF